MDCISHTLNGTNSNSTPQEEQNFYIFGNNIAHSLSPQLHNSGFAKIQYPGNYTIHETVNVDDSVERLLRQPNFGGASVTFPHKLQIGKLVDTITPRAIEVGAVNTVVVKKLGNGGRILEGDNTDWSGIRSCIDKSHLPNLESCTAVVLGAGGAARAACYALGMLNVKDIIIVNRTRSKAQEMAAHFPKLSPHMCTDLKDVYMIARSPVRIIVACVPADDLTEDVIPSSLYSEAYKGILVEMAYRPLETGMMKVASRYSGWKIYNGMDVLREQAYAQFELWTGKEAPTKVMEAAMDAELERRRAAQPAL